MRIKARLKVEVRQYRSGGCFLLKTLSRTRDDLLTLPYYFEYFYGVGKFLFCAE